MIIDFSLKVEGARMKVRVPQAGLDEDVANLVAYRQDNNRLQAVGQTPEAVRTAQPELWARSVSNLAFMPPFSGDAFDRGIAILVMRIYVARTVQAIRPGGTGLLLSGLLDSINYDLELPDFSSLPAGQQRLFIAGLQDNKPRLRRLRINGQLLAGR